MVDESHDLRSDQRPKRRGLRPFYMWTLIAAVAVTAVGSSTLVRLAAEVGAVGYPGRSWSAIVLHEATMALVVATLVLAPIAAVRNRSQDREAARSYGGAAVLAAATGLSFAALKTLLVAVQFLSSGTQYAPGRNWVIYLIMTVSVAADDSVLAIAAVWLILALTGVGRRSANGFERFCLGLGFLWILAYMVRHVLEVARWLM